MQTTSILITTWTAEMDLVRTEEQLFDEVGSSKTRSKSNDINGMQRICK